MSRPGDKQQKIMSPPVINYPSDLYIYESHEEGDILQSCNFVFFLVNCSFEDIVSDMVTLRNSAQGSG